MSEQSDQSSSMDSRAMFAAAAQEESDGTRAGTFCASSSPDAHKAVSSSNLDAAVAALTNGEDGLRLPETNDAPLPQEVNLRHGPIRPPPEPTPMYNEKVLLPRPLFFGPVLPPRVIKEAREAVADAMKELNLDLSQRPRLSQLPPHVRNVVGAVESFGYGIPVFPCDVTDEDSYRGNEYVSTFQPVWGDVARAERERLNRIYRASQPQEPSPAASETTLEEAGQTPVTRQAVGDGSSGDVNCSSTAEQEPNIVGSISFPERKSPNNVAKSLLLRSKSAPVTGKGPPTPPMSEKDQFLQWARGKPVSPARNKPNDAVKKSPSNEKDLFSQWARGKSASPELDIVKARSDTAPDDRDLFSKWAQGSADQSPTVAQNRKVDTMDGKNSDVAVFSKWAQAGVGESPARLTPDEDKADIVSTDKPSPVPIPNKKQFSQWAQGSSPSTSAPAEDDKVEKSDAAATEKDMFAKWASGDTRESNTPSPGSDNTDRGHSDESTLR